MRLCATRRGRAVGDVAVTIGRSDAGSTWRAMTEAVGASLADESKSGASPAAFRYSCDPQLTRPREPGAERPHTPSFMGGTIITERASWGRQSPPAHSEAAATVGPANSRVARIAQSLAYVPNWGSHVGEAGDRIPQFVSRGQAASMSSIFLGQRGGQHSWPAAVTTTSSSIRMPMPRSSGGTSGASAAT